MDTHLKFKLVNAYDLIDIEKMLWDDTLGSTRDKHDPIRLEYY